MKIIPADLDEERQGRLVFIRDGLAAWRDYRRVGLKLMASATKDYVLRAVRVERTIRVDRLRDRLLRDIRDPREV